jgi:hypothetical protein
MKIHIYVICLCLALLSLTACTFNKHHRTTFYNATKYDIVVQAHCNSRDISFPLGPMGLKESKMSFSCFSVSVSSSPGARIYTYYWVDHFSRKRSQAITDYVNQVIKGDNKWAFYERIEPISDPNLVLFNYVFDEHIDRNYHLDADGYLRPPFMP